MIDKEVFTKKISNDIYSDKTFKKFYYSFEEDGKKVEGTLDYTNKKFNRSMGIAVAKAAVSKIKKSKKQVASNKISTTDKLVAQQFGNTEAVNIVHLNYYNKFIKSFIGNTAISSINKDHIKNIFQSLVKVDQRLSSFKIVKELLSELFSVSYKKGLIKINPVASLNLEYDKYYIKYLKEKINEVYNVVNIEFKDDPLIKSFFLFLFKGKKSNKILKLKWELIDFKSNVFYLRKKKSKGHFLHPAIKNELLKIKRKSGLVYENDFELNGDNLTIDEQCYRINQYIPEFTIESLEYIIEELNERQSFGEVAQPFLAQQNNSQIPNKQ